MRTPRDSPQLQACLSAALLALGGVAGSVAVAAARYRGLSKGERKKARRRLRQFV